MNIFVINYLILFFFIILIFIISILIVLEILMRFIKFLKYKFYFKRVIRQDFLDSRYHPYINWTDKWDKPMFKYVPMGIRIFNNNNPVKNVKNNSLGFRCEEFSEYFNKDTYKIFIVGGSAGWGFGASDNSHTISGYLEDIINNSPKLLKDYRGCQVINLCQVNQTQTQDIQTLTWLLPKIRPNIVIHYGGWNELVGSITIDEDIIKEYDIFPIGELVGWSPLQAGKNMRNTFFKIMHLKLRKYILLYDYIINKFVVQQSMFKRTVKENQEVVQNLFISNMERINTISNAYGAKYLQVCQPHMYKKKYLTKIEQKAIELWNIHRPMLGGMENAKYLESNSLYKKIIERVSNKQIYGEILNLEDIFEEEKGERYFSLAHCQDSGYKEIAEKIYNTLKDKYL